MVRGAIFTFERAARKYKTAYWHKFCVGARKQVYAALPKKKKRATSDLLKMIRYYRLRFFFSRFCINAVGYRHITHPRTKRVAAAQCLQRRFRVVRQRLAFLKLRKNLNMHLRHAGVGTKEADKDLFIQLNQILLTSYGQQGGLEGAFQYALGEIFGYLRQEAEKSPELPYAGRVDEGHTGHLDEAIISLKSKAFSTQYGSPIEQGND